jgi:hypothetical protein
MCFFSSADQAYLEQHETYSSLNYNFHEVFLSKTQLSHGNNLLNAPGSNTEVFFQVTPVFLQLS